MCVFLYLLSGLEGLMHPQPLLLPPLTSSDGALFLVQDSLIADNNRL